ncbi:hypothetical protein TKK_0008475 [Trichogramma kaykai]
MKCSEYDEMCWENFSHMPEIILGEGSFVDEFFAELEGSANRNNNILGNTVESIRIIHDISQQSYFDEHGFTNFHKSCLAGDAEAVQRSISEGIDVDIDTWKCSPLHIAVQNRHKKITEILLENGANPNKRDHEKSTPLHALTRLCLCKCGTIYHLCDYKKPVDEIVDILIEKGANIEARDKYGDSPLSLAVSRFDVDVTRALLKHGACLDSLNEDKIFNRNFTLTELKNYPLTLNIIEVMRLLQSADYEVNLRTRIRMLTFWTRLRGNDADHSIPYGAGWSEDCLIYREILYQIYIHKKFGFFIKQEALDYLLELKKKLRSKIPRDVANYKPRPEIINNWELQVVKLNDIKLNGDISLYNLCQISHEKGYSIIKNMKNWQVPSLEGLEHGHINLIVKRHLANILIRPQLELFGADLLMTNYCKLNLPNTVCRIVAEKMSDEELFRLCVKADEDNLGIPKANGDVCEENELRVMSIGLVLLVVG